jgi:hypothetical protein
MFIDNNAALNYLVNGSSGLTASDAGALVSHFWLGVARLCAFFYMDRVKSTSNLADGPSRYFAGDEGAQQRALLRKLGAVPDEPVMTTLLESGELDRFLPPTACCGAGCG